MNFRDYLEHPDVRDFIDWMTNLVKGEWGLAHKWTSKGRGSGGCRQFKCKSLCDAYKRYHWRGTMTLSGSPPVTVKEFHDTSALFDTVRAKLRYAIAIGDSDSFLALCTEVLKWGGIYNNKSLPKLGQEALKILKAKATLLKPECADTGELRKFEFMNAGYSKIYALMIDDFPMYDSRTASGLTSLIWLFCGRKQAAIPDLLKLGIPRNRGSQDLNPYGFPAIRWGQETKYADSNLKAAWLLGALAQKIDDEDGFGKAPKKRRLLALQSGLFMIGYKPLEANAIMKRRR